MYNDEIAFLGKKLDQSTGSGKTPKLEWKAIAPLEQVVSQFVSQTVASEAVFRFRDVFSPKIIKAGKSFEAMISTHNSKDGIRIIAKIPLLREVFGDEIDGFSGGGGRKLRVNPNPLRTGMRR